jgi:hypothetical protein
VEGLALREYDDDADDAESGEEEDGGFAEALERLVNSYHSVSIRA